MPQRTGMWTRSMGGLAVLAVLASGGSASAALGQGPKAPPAALPPGLVAAWQKAGAKVGWLRVEAPVFDKILFNKAGKAGDVPAFRFDPWKDGVVAKLPPPAVPFGLDLAGTQVTDAGLKELAGLKILHALYLGGTRVTDAGLKELRKALPGCEISR